MHLHIGWQDPIEVHHEAVRLYTIRAAHNIQMRNSASSMRASICAARPCAESATKAQWALSCCCIIYICRLRDVCCSLHAKAVLALMLCRRQHTCGCLSAHLRLAQLAAAPWQQLFPAPLALCGPWAGTESLQSLTHHMQLTV